MSIVTNHSEELQKLEILREYKKIFAGDGSVNHSPFSDDRVIRIDSDVTPWDIPEVHCEVRNAIKENIKSLHYGKASRVIILAGEPGMGKSHLLNHFRDEKLQNDLGYIYVGNNNAWKVDEFEPFLLTWLVSALTKPNYMGPNLLLDKMSDLAFQAPKNHSCQGGSDSGISAHETSRYAAAFF